MITAVIDPGADGALVAPGVSEELDGLRELFWSLPDLLTQLVRSVGAEALVERQPPLAAARALLGAPHAPSMASPCPAQVEAELRRVPREMAHGLEQGLWSCVYMPQVRLGRRLHGRHGIACSLT